ncbi:hypothetical protein BASA61_002515, partial [Batrachochytrium salamandrivorans]
MRAGTGIILSVLSPSALAAVIPNYDSHGLLLARRAVNTDPMDLLWKRNNGEQTGTGTGIGESNPNHSGDNSGSSKMGRLREFAKELRMSFMKNRDPRKHKYILEKDKKSLQNAAKKLAEVTEGENKDDFISRIDVLLRIELDSTRMTLENYENKTKIPFFLYIPKTSTQKSLTKAMVKIQNNGKKHTKKHLGAITHAINNIAKHPRNVINELEKITESASHMCKMLKDLYNGDYTALASKVNPTDNKKHIKKAKAYVSDMEDDWDSALEVVKIIKKMIISGGVTFKVRAPSKFANFKSGVQKRLGIKNKSSTGGVLSPEESDHQISGQDTSNQEEPKQGPSDGDTS